MTEKKVTVWTLNKAADLLEKEQENIIGIFKGCGYDAVFGTRENTGDVPINLMPGNEYFVPIAPKCIGDLFDKTPDNQLLKNIRQYYTQEAKQHDYQYFWEPGPNDYRMETEKYKGYYSILRETAPNFLIGYSQGGLVARYLLWLAETVFKEPDVVKGVITVSSPNFGSPLANPDNLENIILGLYRIIKIIFSSSSEAKQLVQKLQAGKVNEKHLDSLLKILKSLISELKNNNNGLQGILLQKAAQFNGILESIIDWMGGLRNDPNNAFYDLNISRLKNEFSIPASVFTTNPYHKVRGIISTDNKLADLLGDLSPHVRESLWDVIKKDASLELALDIKPDLENKTVARKKRECSEVIPEIEDIYNKVIMEEQIPESELTPLIEQRINNYNNGIPGLKIDPYAHDFVIPSAYQLTVDNENIPTGLNLPNYEANHLTGSSVIFDAGQQNVGDIKTLIRDVMKE